jgi:hypothetical protein
LNDAFLFEKKEEVEREKKTEAFDKLKINLQQTQI